MNRVCDLCGQNVGRLDMLDHIIFYCESGDEQFDYVTAFYTEIGGEG